MGVWSFVTAHDCSGREMAQKEGWYEDGVHCVGYWNDLIGNRCVANLRRFCRSALEVG